MRECIGDTSCNSTGHGYHDLHRPLLRCGGSFDGPTLHNRERIIVEKISYRFREPARGEIIVLKNPWRPDQSGMAAVVEAVRELVDFSGSMRPYIKRVVAVAGDRVQIRNGILHLNGKPVDEPYVNEMVWSDYGPLTVPQGHVFVLGDNRNNSDDSRGSVGFLRVDRIIGRAWVRYYPLNKICALKAPAVLRIRPFDRHAHPVRVDSEHTGRGVPEANHESETPRNCTGVSLLSAPQVRLSLISGIWIYKPLNV